MKSIIIYYSFSGNTKKIAAALSQHLQTKGEVEVIELKALDESDKFLSQASRAFRRKRAKIAPAKYDLSGYDLVCFGTPVWAFGPACAMNTYLDICSGITGKQQIILFTTYGSGTGNERCLNYMQDILAKKGAGSFKRFSLQQLKVDNREFVINTIEAALSK